VAYLVAAEHGLATDDYTFAYVAGWAADVDQTRPEDVVRDTGTTAIIRWTATQTLPDGSPYANHGVYIVKMRWGRAWASTPAKTPTSRRRVDAIFAAAGVEDASPNPDELEVNWTGSVCQMPPVAGALRQPRSRPA